MAELDVDPFFHQLDPLSDTFGSQLRALSIDVQSSTIASYSLTILASEMREEFVLQGAIGTFTSRSFSPVDGSQIGTDDVISFPTPPGG